MKTVTDKFFEKQIIDGLKTAIFVHGLIGKQLIPSATKRILAQLNGYMLEQRSAVLTETFDVAAREKFGRALHEKDNIINALRKQRDDLLQKLSKR